MIRKAFSTIALVLALTLALSCLTAYADLYAQDEVESLVQQAWQQAMEAASQDGTRQAEVTSKKKKSIATDSGTVKKKVYSISDGTYTMRYLMSVIGDADENGLYPLYICLHGGGSDSADGKINNGQWVAMYDYYRDSVTSGIYVAVRGITNNWNLHFEDASYALYDRLIEDMIVFKHADPNRVYLLGFSAGGDGVYAVSPRMADRFAAVDESSGHPNSVSLVNVANLPMCIQAGIRDTMFEPKRSVAAAAFDEILSGYAQTYGFGYEHQVYIHVPEGHNYRDNEAEAGSTQKVLAEPQTFVDAMEDPEVEEAFDYSYSYDLSDEVNEAFTELVEELGLQTVQADTNAVRFVNRYVRNANPEQVVWDLSVRASGRETTSFYWLDADREVNTGVIEVSFDAESNTFTVSLPQEPNGDFSILLRPGLVDFSRPVCVSYAGKTVEVDVKLDEDLMAATAADTLDAEMVSAARISFASLGLKD